MNKNSRNKIVTLVVLGFGVIVGYTNCSDGFKIKTTEAEVVIDQASTTQEVQVFDPDTGEVVTTSGPRQASASVPTVDGVIARVKNGLEGRVNPLSGNFAAGLAVFKGNLPKVSNPLQASGYDQSQLAIYAACSDLTTGATPIMQSAYNVTANGSVTNNQAALVAAGIRILDQHTAGLSSSGPMSADVNKIFSELVTKSAAVAGNTSRIAFMSICIAANTAGVLMLGN